MGFGGQGLIYLNPKIAYLLKDLYKEIIIGNPETEKVGYLGFRLGFKTLAVGSQLENEWARACHHQESRKARARNRRPKHQEA